MRHKKTHWKKIFIMETLQGNDDDEKNLGSLKDFKLHFMKGGIIQVKSSCSSVSPIYWFSLQKFYFAAT